MQEHFTKSSDRHKYFMAAIFANVLWGFVAIVFRNIADWPSETILYFRIFTSLLVIWIFILAFRFAEIKRDWFWMKELSKTERNHLFRLAVVSSVLIIGNWFTFIYAVNRISIRSAAFAYLVCPLITTLAGYFFLKEKLTRRQWLSLAIALGSVLMLAHGSLVEVIWSITIASFYSCYLIIQRILQHVDKLNLLAIQLIICSIIVLPVMMLNYHPIPISSVFWTNISIIATVFTVIPLFLSMFALNKITSGTMGILLYINPVISFAVAVLYFGEMISITQLIAYSLLFSAIVLYNSEIIKQIFSSLAKREIT